MSAPHINSTYFKQIDALRALAVAMVIFSHWAGYHEYLWNDDSFWFNGEVGVQLFFIISGFLITGILLDERERAKRLQSKPGSILKAFYIRRFLRIFPLFYGTLFIGFILGHPDVRQSIHWHIPYLSNFFFASRGEYMGDVSHFWSLAVEEQFYFVWPFLILFIPRRFLPPVIILCIAMGPSFRFLVGVILHANDVAVNVLPFSSLDSLAGGALLAILHRRSIQGGVSSALTKWIVGGCIACGIAYIFLRMAVPVSESMQSTGVFIARTLLAPGLCAVVWYTAKGIKGRIGEMLQWEPVAYVGRISYGLYVFHFFIPGITAWIFHRFDFLIWERFGVGTYLLVNIVVLLTLSALSWHFFESRINALKKFFPYTHNSNIPRPTFRLSVVYSRLIRRHV